MVESFKKYYAIIKDNVFMITIVPYILGGLYQLYNLSKISTNLVSFFSLTQCISDGLLVLIFLIIIPMTPILFTNDFVIIMLDKIPKTKAELNAKPRKKIEYEKGRIIAIVLFSIMLFISIRTVFLSDFNLNSISRTFSMIITLQLTCYIFYNLIFFIFRLNENLKILFIGFYVVNLLISLYSFSLIKDNTMKIDNFKALIESTTKDDISLKEAKILYFNDKYIFIEAKRDKSKIILIKKTDDLFLKK